MENGMLHWHPALGGVIWCGLEKTEDEIMMLEEFGLSKMPMRIDLLIVKKNRDFVNTDIGRILRGHNVFEYKSPWDSLSIDDFYKAYAYACFYKSNTEQIDAIQDTDITITLICSHYPRKMLDKLEKSRNIKPRLTAPGVYYLEGDPIPIQLIVVKKLSYKNKGNLWLSSLRTDLTPGDHLDTLLEDYQKHKGSKMYQEMMDVIVRANYKAMKEARVMCNALHELWKDDLDKEVEKIRVVLLQQLTVEVTQQLTEEVTQQLTEEVTQQVTEEVTQQVTEEVTQQVTEEVTQQVTEEVTQQVTEEVTQHVIHDTILAFAEAFLEEQFSQFFICMKLQEKFAISEDTAKAYIQEAEERLIYT